MAVETKSAELTREESAVFAAFSRARLSLMLVFLVVHFPGSKLGELVSVSHSSTSAATIIAALWIGLALLASRLSRMKFPLFSGATYFLFFDNVAITALLFEAGGASNPFSMFYFVPIALATLLEPKETIVVVLSAVVGFGVLLFRTLDSEGLSPHFLHHVTGMVVALALAGTLLAYFVRHVSAALVRKERRIEKLESEREQARVATTLGALAAGAAHELGTPLGTVRLLAEELVFAEASERAEIGKTIDRELLRMKEILQSMSSSELSASVLEERPWNVRDLVSDLAGEFERGVEFEREFALETSQPKVIVLQIARELVRNALRAAKEGTVFVRVMASGESTEFSIFVEDEGEPLEAERFDTLFDPFVSHSGGRGLGLFLARTHARQLGGDLCARKKEPRGLSFELRLPRTFDFEGVSGA